MNFPLRIAFPVSHRFWIVVSSFSFVSKYLSISSWSRCWPFHRLITYYLASMELHIVSVFFSWLISRFIALWSYNSNILKSIHWVTPARTAYFFYFSKTSHINILKYNWWYHFIPPNSLLALYCIVNKLLEITEILECHNWKESWSITQWLSNPGLGTSARNLCQYLVEREK